MKLPTLPVYCLALLTTVLIGCGDPDAGTTPVQEADVDAANDEKDASEHVHVHVAPHGGHLIEIGDHEYNIEMVFSEEPRELHAYVLGGHAVKPIPLELESFDFDQEDDQGNETEITLTANPQDGDAEGSASRFTAKGDALPAEIKSLEDLHGHVHIEIDGTQREGDLHHDHDDEDEKGHHEKDGKGHDDDKDNDHKDGDKDADAKPDGEAKATAKPDGEGTATEKPDSTDAPAEKE